jgi:DNA-binding NarL/FixJ family response regulator
MPETIRLLLVDDHPFVRDGVRMRLEATGQIAVVGEAGCVEDAVQLATQLSGDQAPHIVLTDISMRTLSGIELTSQFRQHFPDIGVLVLSMHNNPEYVRRAFDEGARGYVLKDAPAQELVDAIQAVYAGQTYFSLDLRDALNTSQAVTSPDDDTTALTPKELATMQSLARGYSNKQIANVLGMSVRTVETHRLNIRRKLGIGGQAELVKYAIDHTRATLMGHNVPGQAKDTAG